MYINVFVNVIFSLSLFLNAAFFIPQAIKIIKTKQAKDLSLITFVGFNIMQIFTAWHGYIVKDYILMIGFVLSFITCGLVTSLILIYRWHYREETTKSESGQNRVALESIIANMPGHVYWKDKNGVYLGCNNQQARSLGLNYGHEVVGKTDFELPWKAGDAEQFRKNDIRIMETGTPELFEEKAVFNGKPSSVLSLKAPFYDENGKVLGVIGISTDITAEKEAEQLRVEKLAVEESLKAAQLMAASIAHEMRTPLGTISAVAGNLESLMPTVLQGYEIAKSEEKIEDPLSRKSYEYFKESPHILTKVVSGANTFINMMLMKFNPENVKADELVRLSMASSVSSAVATYPMDEEERALVKVNTEHDFEFMGDITLLEHIIFNLLKNALHYLKVAKKGEIQIWLEPGKDENIVHFKDTGKGMPPDVVKNLFGNFYSKTRHGTGVGLALCKMIMQEFKGTITCESVEGEYTHFKLSFPKIN